MTHHLRSIVLLFVAVAVAGCSKEPPEEVESHTVVPVTVAAAQTGAIIALTRATGVVVPAPGAELLVVAPEPARIVELPKAEGDTVRRGDVLVRFEIPSTTAELSKQQAETQRAQARLENAKAAQARAHDLFERGVAARKEVEDADREIADANADLSGARAAVAAAETIAGRSVVRATFDGIVAKRSHNPGDLVEAAAADAVLRIIDPRRLEVLASVPVAESLRLKVGEPARIADVPNGLPAAALRVVARPASVQEGTATVSVRLAFMAATNYPVGTPVQVAIETGMHDGVVLVPISAVVHEGEETAVFVVEKDTAHRRVVKTGFEDDEQIEIASGVKAGEMVITSGHNGLPDGATITLNKPNEAGAAEKQTTEGAGAKPDADRK
jgi:membrane fusion protein, multidrug efflux system